VFGNILEGELRSHVPNLPPQVIAALRQNVGAIASLPSAQKLAAIAAYIASLDRIYLIGVPVGVLASLSASIAPNYNLAERTALGRREVPNQAEEVMESTG